jgi:NAD(P)-dependent dehydrogenase (short-subunit alcohol dehydrogenase family)
MDGLVRGKAAIITGAGSGVGRAAARLFAAHGATLLLADINTAACEETAAQVKAAGGEAIARTCNVADAGEVDALVAAAVAAFRRLDIMYNNVGITITPKADGSGRRFIEASQADIDRLFAVNVYGVMNGCRAAARQFEAQGSGGAIVSTASVVGLIGMGNAVYSATKGAVVALTRTLAIEFAPLGIRVNSVCPSGMPSNFMPGSQSEAGLASMASHHPLGRHIDPAECASAALFLASDLASNVTGVNMPVDGGLSAGVPVRRKA